MITRSPFLDSKLFSSLPSPVSKPSSLSLRAPLYTLLKICHDSRVDSEYHSSTFTPVSRTDTRNEVGLSVLVPSPLT